MISQRFLQWKDTADVAKRAAAASAMGRAYLQCEMEFEERCGAEAALTLLADDPSPKVRMALCEAIAGSQGAPEQVVTVLAADQFDIASIIVARSPVLRDRDLARLVEGCDQRLHTTMARRPVVGPALVRALTRHADAQVAAILLDHPNAALDAGLIELMAERHGCDARLRGLLLERPELSSRLKYRLARKTADALSSMSLFANLCGEARARNSVDKAWTASLVQMVDGIEEDGHSAFIDELRANGDLTTTFLVRIACHGKMDFFAHVLADLSGQSLRRVTGILVQERGAQLDALLESAGLSAAVRPVFDEAIRLWRHVAQGRLQAGVQEVTRRVAERVENARDNAMAAANDDILALLRSIYLDVMRHNARLHAQSLSEASERADVPMLEQAPLSGTVAEVAQAVSDDAPIEPEFDTDFELAFEDELQAVAA